MKVNPQAAQFLERCYFALTKAVDTPVSLSCWILFKHGEFEQLVKKEVDPNDYMSFEDWDRDYFVVKYLSKYVGFETGLDLDQLTLDGWKAAEAQCKSSNQRLKKAASLTGVESVMFTAQRKIAAVLPSLILAQALDACRWGPGSTFTLKGENATLVDKIREFPISVTPRALGYLKTVIEADPHWMEAIINTDGDRPLSGPASLLPCCFTTVRGCRGTLVAKSAKIKRSIAIEPTGNIFLQLGVGRIFRKALRRVGVDLNDQTLNQRLAMVGSSNGSLATLDLSSASDTVCTELVYKLFPLEWAIYLDRLRSPEIQWDKGTWVRLEKFSSMGNGFTFELESLIFWALTSATLEVQGVRGNLGIYGDDIICPVECVPLLREVLAYCGFTLNKDKSHDSGYFRESCGRHFYGGRDCTPVYQKEVPDTLPELYRLANRIYRSALQNDYSDFACRRGWLRGVWQLSCRTVAEYFLRSRYYTNVGMRGNTDKEILLSAIRAGLHLIPARDPSDDGLMLPLRWLQFGIIECRHGGWKLPVLSFRPKQKTADGRPLLAYLLRFGSEESFNGRVAVRRRGKYLSRRRWFYPTNWGASPATLDVAI